MHVAGRNYSVEEDEIRQLDMAVLLTFARMQYHIKTKQ